MSIPFHQVRHIGHEIRTPLNVVGVGVDMLIKELEQRASVLPDSLMEIVNDIKVHFYPSPPNSTHFTH